MKRCANWKVCIWNFCPETQPFEFDKIAWRNSQAGQIKLQAEPQDVLLHCRRKVFQANLKLIVANDRSHLSRSYEELWAKTVTLAS